MSQTVAARSRTRQNLALFALAALVGIGSTIGYGLSQGPVPAAPDPLPSTPAAAASPAARSATTESGRRRITILGAGDVLVHPPVWEQARRDNGGTGYDFAPMFAGVRDTISRADLALCHLETPIAAPGRPPSGYPSFNAPPQVLDGIRSAGFDGCSTASNHVIDQGATGVTSTLDALDRAGLGHAGSARSAKEAATPMIYRVKGVRVGHLSYTLHFNGQQRPAGREWLANLIDPAAIQVAAKQARAAGAEVVVLSLHWGTEYQHTPDADQLRWARELLALPEIDLILGHHAHVVQPFEKIGDKWVVYGMGNELARHAEPGDANREGVMARITMTETAAGRWRVSLAEAIPTWTEITPRIRLVELPKALAGPSLAAQIRRVWQAAYDRISGYLDSRAARSRGLLIGGTV